MQYTIETRELTREHARHSGFNAGERPVVVEAPDANEAITRYVQQSGTELVSISRADRGQESIATVRKDDLVYLVRVYAA